MVSDQVVSLLLVPTKAGASWRCPVHRGVNEKQPLRGIYFIARDINSSRWPSRLYSEQVQSPASAGSVATAKVSQKSEVLRDIAITKAWNLNSLLWASVYSVQAKSSLLRSVPCLDISMIPAQGCIVDIQPLKLPDSHWTGKGILCHLFSVKWKSRGLSEVKCSNIRDERDIMLSMSQIIGKFVGILIYLWE